MELLAFLHYKLTIISLVTNKDLHGEILWDYAYALFLIKIPPTNISMHWSFSPELLLRWCLSSGGFLSPSCPTVRSAVLPPLFTTYQVTYLYQYKFMDIIFHGLLIVYSYSSWLSLLLKLPQIWPLGGLSAWFPCFFNRFPSLLSTFLISGMERCSSFILYFLCPSPEISYYSKEAFLILLENT